MFLLISRKIYFENIFELLISDVLFCSKMVFTSRKDEIKISSTFEYQVSAMRNK